MPGIRLNRLLAFLLMWLAALLGGCLGEHEDRFEWDASSIHEPWHWDHDWDAGRPRDAGRTRDGGRPAVVDSTVDPGEQEPDADQPPEEDAGAPAEEEDAAQVDAAPPVEADDAAQADAAPPVEAEDAAPPVEEDGGQGEEEPDAGGALPDAGGGCAAGEPADLCGICGGDGSSCSHRLAGRYAVRTQLYARQKASIEGSELDLVSKIIVLSIADIDAQGVAREHYCFLELVNADGVFSWITPAALERVPDTAVQLEEQPGGFLRPLAEHQAYFSWSPEVAPPDCVPGQMHATGCRCAAGDALPTTADDCRVLDIDQDTVPGGAMYLGFAPVADPSVPGSDLKLNIVALLSLEWQLGASAGGLIVGDIAGGLEQSVLSKEGSLAPSVQSIKNAMCPSELGHVELVKGDFTCASVLARRATDAASYGIFDAALDGDPPAATDCPDPNCSADTDRDGSSDCDDACQADPLKTAAGACGCGSADTNSDGDSAPDCTDGCPNDAAKLAPGTCGCGVADQDLNGDGTMDCSDGCPADPAKVTPGLCGCGTPDSNSDGDSLPDCTDECDADATKTAPGVCGCGSADEDRDGDGLPTCNDACPDDGAKTTLGLCGCGVAETDTDGDSTPDCTDECDSDPGKTAPGACGCGIADQDLNSDGTIDCNDSCPADPAKVAPGVCGCGVADTNTDGDSMPDCTDECDGDGSKLAPGQCGCGLADVDADGDGVANCNDACPNDSTKTTLGACGCGVADTNSDGDSAPDCTDQCANDPTRTTPGECGCADCAVNPLVGSYAVRSAVFGRQRNGSEVVTSKSLNYALITVNANTDGTLRLSEQGCWTQSLPNPNGTGTKAYSWSKPAWVQAVPASVQNLVANTNGTYTRAIALTHYGWDPARQPAGCSASATPSAPWPSAWGATCTCNTPATSLPPYDKDASLFDCRMVDADGDGQPGLSAIAATAAPASPDANPPTLGGTAFAAVDGGGSWLITPASDGRHTATIDDQSNAQLIGCSGIACSSLAATPPGSRACPQALNRAQFVPVTASSDSCSEIIAARDTLFVQNQDPAWPDDSACPPP